MYIDYGLFSAIVVSLLIPMIVYLWIATWNFMSVMNSPTARELASGEQRFLRFRKKNGAALSPGQALRLSLRNALPGFLLAAAIVSYYYLNIHIDPESRRRLADFYFYSNFLLWREIFLFYFLALLFHLPCMLTIFKLPAKACMRHYGKCAFYFIPFLFSYCILGFIFSHILTK